MDSKIISFFILLIVPFNLHAQKIENVTATQQGKKVAITYDITGAVMGQTFTTKLLYSADGYTWLTTAVSLTGDIGVNVKGGTGKQILWDALKDVNKLAGKDFLFKVQAGVSGGSSSGEITDIDGNTYKTVIIGTQT